MEMSSILTDGGGGGVRGLSQCVQLYTGAQTNFGDLTPYLTYDSTLSYMAQGIGTIDSNPGTAFCEELFAEHLTTRINR
jgi:hypothetical protein